MGWWHLRLREVGGARVRFPPHTPPTVRGTIGGSVSGLSSASFETSITEYVLACFVPWKWFATRRRKLKALESIAESLRSDPQSAGKLVSDLEARVAQHVVALQKAVADLQTRAPPEAHLREMIANLEVQTDKNTQQINSLRSKVYREFPEGKKRRAASDEPTFALGYAGPPPLDMTAPLGAEAQGDD